VECGLPSTGQDWNACCGCGKRNKRSLAVCASQVPTSPRNLSKFHHGTRNEIALRCCPRTSKFETLMLYSLIPGCILSFSFQTRISAAERILSMFCRCFWCIPDDMSSYKASWCRPVLELLSRSRLPHQSETRALEGERSLKVSLPI